VFRGNSEINMDAKGRMAIPTRYRDLLSAVCGGRLVATIDTEDKCLLIYPDEEWQIVEDKLRKLPTFNPTTRRYQRLLIGHAKDMELDGSGRLLIPPELRDYAGLTKKVVLVGQGLRFELWDSESWAAKRDEMLAEDLDMSAIPEEMQSLSL
jgi:MraZ protein